jgi:hypothetical protein
MSIDASIAGMVFAIILFIVFFSAIVLYLAYRIKETFRSETRRGIVVIKIVFLVGILFLAGGSFYFLANTFPTSSADPTHEPPSDNGTAQLTLVVNYPTSIRMNTNLIVSFTLTNPTSYTAHDVLIQTAGLLDHFTLVSSTHNINSNILSIAEVPSGNSICTLELTSPDRPITIRETITVTYLEMTEPVTQQISITIQGGR